MSYGSHQLWVYSVWDSCAACGGQRALWAYCADRSSCFCRPSYQMRIPSERPCSWLRARSESTLHGRPPARFHRPRWLHQSPRPWGPLTPSMLVRRPLERAATTSRRLLACILPGNSSETRTIGVTWNIRPYVEIHGEERNNSETIVNILNSM